MIAWTQSQEKAETADRRAQAVEEKVDRLQEQMTQLLRGGRPSGSGSEVDRRFTLIYGGWPRDTRKQVILQQLSEALEQLGVQDLLDHPAFCTGPRRSTVMSVFTVRPGESEYSTRRRMHNVIMALANNEVNLPGSQKKMFATYSKSRAERAVASHAGWLKRTVTTMGQEIASQLDVEYATGTCWLGSSMVGSATRPTEPGTDEQGMLREEHEGIKVWVDVKSLAKECRKSTQDIRRMLEDHRR